jgi:hypothetical protein
MEWQQLEQQPAVQQQQQQQSPMKKRDQSLCRLLAPAGG